MWIHLLPSGTFWKVLSRSRLQLRNCVEARPWLSFSSMVSYHLYGVICTVGNQLMPTCSSAMKEFNTSSVLGLCKEVIIDHTLAGQPLAENIVVIAACNPARQQTITVNLRERDLARDWVGGHYQVSDLPPSVKKIKWAFGSLNRDQEKEFILKRLEFMADGDCSMPSYLRVALTEFIAESQQAMRTFATRSIRDGLIREFGETSEQVDELAGSRAQSIVSLRDIQRVFSLFDFYSSYLRLSSIGDAVAAQTHRNAMLLAIATVYYLRLDSHNRTEFLKMTRSLPAEQGQKNDLQHVLDLAMDEVIAATEIPPAIAVTRGLKENVFMTFVCTLSKSPLMMVGPPGASKVRSPFVFISSMIFGFLMPFLLDSIGEYCGGQL